MPLGPVAMDSRSGMVSDLQRIVTLAGAHNVRDLGGLPTVDGRRTRRGRLFRSEFLASPDTHSDPARDLLGLRTVVDLRRFGEVEHEQVPWGDHAIDLVHVPLRLESGSSWHAGYHRYLVDGPDRVARAVRTLIDPGNGPALFHCAAGKDRTGVIAAVILDLLGVRHEAIVEDYMLTARGITPILERVSKLEPYRAQLRGTAIEQHLPRRDLMVDFLEWLSAAGGARNWLVENGTPEEELTTAKQALVAS